METGVFLLGGVEMADAGAGPPLSTDRRYDNETVWSTSERMLDMGVKAEEVGLDIFWLTEHHFQYEGYEVIPNALMFGAVLAERTRRIRIGALFNIVPQWHPLRLAEDFATLHNLSGGRGILGVGRGTVPR
jgi:alkanesulfonate monooxygenase SsuD/methylene tetrahydromethanopterin reductase-like flavin-dependent oxidoreductase (luciferase family)